MIYLDNSATTKPYPEVVEAVRQVMEKYYGNPSSLHQKGVEAEQVLKQARQIAADALQVKPGEIIFTSGGTESNNTAIKGVALQYRNRGKHLITTQIEHPAVYDVCRQLEEFGYEVTYLPVNREGRVSVQDLKQAIRPDTILVSVMHVNNELGTIQPIAEIGSYLKQFPKILFHVDAVQSFGKIPVDVGQWGIDLLSISAHKFHGPRGVGILYKREGLQIQPLLAGGGQEAGVRSGTENLAGIVGMAKAMRIAAGKREQLAGLFQEMSARLRRGIASIPGCVVNTPERLAAHHIVNFSVPGVKAEVLLHALEENGFLVSTRSACSSKRNEPSRVLMATGMDRERALSAIRLSVGADNKVEEMDRFLDALRDVVLRLRSYQKL